MLIVDDKWLLLGPNRHGNTFAKNVVEAAFPGRTRMVADSKHWPLCKIPADKREGLIVVGIIRDPLMWYCSKWARFWSDEKHQPHKQYGFEEYMNRHRGNPHGPIGKNMEDLPLSEAGIGAWSYKHIAYHCLDARRAFAELKTQQAFTDAYSDLLSVDELMCTETLRRDLKRVFGEPVYSHVSIGIPNSSHKHAETLSYYTPEIIEAVRKGDAWLVKLHPYLKHASELVVA